MEKQYTTIEQLQSLIDNQIEESTILEYKSSFPKKKEEGKPANQKKDWREELAKDISAMANSNGGHIIYGIREKNGPNGHAIPEKLLPVPNSEMSKDQLSQLLSSNIQPIIEGIEITYIPYDNQSGFFDVCIPKGKTAHQNRLSKIYYKRRNATVEAMEDYEIRDVMNRSKTPIIDLEFYIKRIETSVTEIKYPTGLLMPQKNQYVENTFVLYYRPINKGEVYAKYVNYFVYIPKCIIQEEDDDEKDDSNYISKYGDNTIRDLVAIHAGQREYSPFRYEPILPELCGDEKHTTLNFDNIPDLDELPPIKYEIHADNARTKYGSVFVQNLRVETEKKVETIDPMHVQLPLI